MLIYRLDCNAFESVSASEYSISVPVESPFPRTDIFIFSSNCLLRATLRSAFVRSPSGVADKAKMISFKPLSSSLATNSRS